MNEFADNRTFYRMLLNSDVQVTVIDAEINSVSFAFCRDLSATGMAVEMRTPLDLGVRVKVTVPSGTSNVDSLYPRGKVVRVEQDESDIYVIGIAIDDIY